MMMQSLAIPASISKRKQACRSCRQRKRRCDGRRPSCNLCKKWNLRCDYAIPSSNEIETHTFPIQHPGGLPTVEWTWRRTFEQVGALDFMQFPGMNFDFPGFEPEQLQSQADDCPLHISEHDSSLFGMGEQDIFRNIGLPADDILMELVQLFFRHFYHMFPCFHKETLISGIQNRNLQTEAPILLYAMCCLAARYHPDPAVKSRQSDWYEQARFSYELMGRLPEPGLRTIQAVLCLIFHAATIGDYSSGWLHVGKAWRQAVAIGMNRMDSNHAMSMDITWLDADVDHEKSYNQKKAEGQTAIEKEEHRRTLWLLFFIDRENSWPTGWPNAIDERQFKVDIPAAESAFQSLNADSDSDALQNLPFTRNLNNLIASSPATAEPLNLFHPLVIANVLLGRVAAQIHSLHDSPHSPEYAEACAELDSYIIKFKLSLPRAATSILEAPEEARGHVVWLNTTLNTLSILLYFRCSKLNPDSESSKHFLLALAAAKNTAQMIKDASRISIDLLLSARVGSSLYIAAIVLVVQWRITGDDALKEDIDLFKLVFERFKDAFSFMGLKYSIGLKHDLERSKESIVDIREKGFRGLLADCSKWNHVQVELSKLGITPT